MYDSSNINHTNLNNYLSNMQDLNNKKVTNVYHFVRNGGIITSEKFIAWLKGNDKDAVYDEIVSNTTNNNNNNDQM